MVKASIRRLLKHVIRQLSGRNRKKYVIIGRNGNRRFPRGHMRTYVHLLSNKEFSRLFRVDRQTFSELLLKTTPFLPIASEQQAISSSGSMITNEMKLGMTLRWLSGGSYLDICCEYGVSSKTLYSKKGV